MAIEKWREMLGQDLRCFGDEELDQAGDEISDIRGGKGQSAIAARSLFRRIQDERERRVEAWED